MENLHTLYEKVCDLRKTAVKMQLQNIVFPRWDAIGLVGRMLRQVVVTKENPSGQLYDEATFRMVMRILDGKVYMVNGMADAYAWDVTTFQKYANRAKPIGVASGSGLIALAGVLDNISDDKERLDVAEMFSSINRDLLLVTTPEERRCVVEITAELYASGVKTCIDEWQTPDENGNYKETPLEIGDYLVLNTTNHTLYRVRKEEFFLTYKLDVTE